MSQALFLASDEEEESQLKSHSQAKTRATGATSKKRGRQVIEEDEEYEEFDLGSAAIDKEEDAIVEDSGGEETMRTQASTRPKRGATTAGTKRTRKVIQDDDSDDAVFKGFKGKKKRKF